MGNCYLFVLPSPKFNYDTINNFRSNIVFIPKDSQTSQNENSTDKFIPCLLLMNKKEEEKINNFVIMFHGNAEEMFTAWEMADGISKKLKMNVLIVEYPGYSVYDVDKNSDMMLEDSVIVYDYLKTNFENVKDENIFVFGRSIGSAPAIFLASKRNPAALLVVSGFTSVKEVAGHIFGKVFSCLQIIVKNHFTSINYMETVTCPVFFVHGKSDTLIPYTETLRLMIHCIANKKGAYYPPNMTHNDYRLEEDILNPIESFIELNNLRKTGIKTIIPKNLFDIPNDVMKKINNSQQDRYTVYKRNSLIDW